MAKPSSNWERIERSFNANRARHVLHVERWEGEREVAAREPARTVTVGKGIALRAYVRVLDASECAAGGREPAGQNPGKTAGS